MKHCFSYSNCHWLVAGILSALIVATSAFAATTGTISGTVTDADGGPLPGVAVTVEGTRLGATTDIDGQYIILLVPPGEHAVTAYLIGYTATTVTEIQVSADLTSRVNFRLFQEAIEVDAIVVTAERDPIRVDVTSSQTIVDAQRVAEMPVSQMLSVLNYQPGVNVVRGNELEIRGGGPSQIRFQVDGVDRTDGTTGKGYTQLNQVLVSEVTLLTGGFNAEYGNVRSGMVNVVVKEGSERGSLIPWVAAAASYAPPQKKHHGPGAYDRDEYDTRVLLSSDSALTGGAVYWPDLYEQTRTDTAFMSYVDAHRTQYRTYQGWNEVLKTANSLGLRNGPPYMHNGWTIEDIKEAWAWETNVDEQVWGYSHEPDVAVDVAMGWALPKKFGGIVVGYAYNKEMTTVPAVIPYARDRLFEAKITLTPIDNLKLNFGYMTADGKTTGGAAGDLVHSSEPVATAGVPEGDDPVALRGSSELLKSMNEVDAGENNKANLSYSAPLTSEFSQIMGTLTYTLNPRTFFTATFGHSETAWHLKRDLPRADMSPEAFGPDAKWSAKSAWDYGAFLSVIFTYPDSPKPPDMDYATNPDNFLIRSPYSHPNAYPAPPTETKFVTKTFTWEERAWTPARGDRNEATDDTTFNVTVVSPQGWVANPYGDLAGRFTLAGGGEYIIESAGTQTTLRGDITHVIGEHTFKSGIEYIGRDLEYLQEKSGGLYESGIGGGRNSQMRDFGGKFPSAQPKIVGLYLQDKYESDGMIANIGFRFERFDAGHPAWFYDDMFNVTVMGEANSRSIARRLFVEAGIDSNSALLSNLGTNFYKLDELLDGNAPLPHDVVRAWPSEDNKVYWRAAPRVGVSHPVSNKTKFFFNYGIFYSMAKPIHLYGYNIHDGRPGGGTGRIEYIYNANLRPTTTTMYEVGIEHLLPADIVFKMSGYAKYNEDQVTAVIVRGQNFNYQIYRNANYQDVKGYELQLVRNAGRFVNGQISYEGHSSRTGEVSILAIGDDMKYFLMPYLPNVRRAPTRGLLRVFVRVGTPMDWGILKGGWSLGTEYAWQKGGEYVYNPSVLPVRELADENYLPGVAYHNVNVKFSKRFATQGGKHVTAYMDILNVFNRKNLNSNGVKNWQDYLAYIYTRRSLGEDVKVGQQSTLYVLNEPYKIDPADDKWLKPISPATEWIQCPNPRFYRFGMRFEF